MPNILACWKIFVFDLVAFPIINAIFGLTIDTVLDLVGVSSHLSWYLSGWGEGKRAAKGQFSHPGAFLWQILENFAARETWLSYDLQLIFLTFGGCLSGAHGASSKTGFSSGFLKIIDLLCFFRIEPSLCRNGSKLNGAIIS